VDHALVVGGGQERAVFRFRFGSFDLPWESVDRALADAPDGETVWIETGTYDVPSNVIDKPILSRAPLGPVRPE